MKTEEPEAPKPPKKPRKDRGTRRFMLPVALAKSLVTHSIDRSMTVEALLREFVEDYEAPPERFALPPSVLARLAPAAEASGRSISELLAEMEEELCNLLDGKLATYAFVRGAELRDGGDYSGDSISSLRMVPSLEDRLVEAFRACIRVAQIPAAPSSDVVELKEAIKAGLERA